MAFTFTIFSVIGLKRFTLPNTRLYFKNGQQGYNTSSFPQAFTMRILLLFVLHAFASTAALADDIHIAVASNFAQTIKPLASNFEEKTGHHLRISLASTGTLYAQIKHGAPYQVLLSADSATPMLLEQEGLAISDSRFTYAKGKLVLWQSNKTTTDALSSLKTGNFSHLAIANPKLAPYGFAAIETLKQLNVLDARKKQIIHGESIAQTYQFVASKNAQLGFIALSQIIDNHSIEKDATWLVPQALYTPIHQQAIVMKSAMHDQAVMQFIQFLQSPDAQIIIKSHGYDI